MSTTGSRIKTRRLELGLSVEELAAKLGKNRATVYRYESDEIENFPVSIIGTLAEALQTTPSYLMGWDNTEKDSSSTIPPGFLPLPDMTSVPLVGQIACGQPITAEENLEGVVSLPEKWRADFALICKGNSMAPRIQDGDLVAIRIQPQVENGEIAAVRIGDEATLKHVYYHKDYIELRPENSEYDSIIRRRDEMNDVHIEGKAVGFCRGME